MVARTTLRTVVAIVGDDDYCHFVTRSITVFITNLIVLITVIIMSSSMIIVVIMPANVSISIV